MAAVEHALNGDVSIFVWVDIFAVRQWPGNVADLAFEPVVRDTETLLLVAAHIDSVAEMERSQCTSSGPKIPEDALKRCAFFRGAIHRTPSHPLARS